MPESSDPTVAISAATASAGARLSHLDAEGEARMVDVSTKPALFREAVACGEILLSSSTLDLMEGHRMAKGNVLATARIAGIQAAKRTVQSRRQRHGHRRNPLAEENQGRTTAPLNPSSHALWLKTRLTGKAGDRKWSVQRPI
jgi:cyclic pyranopterin phosphate synthase